MPHLNHFLHVHLQKKHRKQLVDRVALVAAAIYPLSGLPQVVLVCMGHTEGVSILSWVFFSLFASFFLFYGVSRRIKPMIITNGLWLAIDLFVVGGTLAHNLL